MACRAVALQAQEAGGAWPDAALVGTLGQDHDVARIDAAHDVSAGVDGFVPGAFEDVGAERVVADGEGELRGFSEVKAVDDAGGEAIGTGGDGSVLGIAGMGSNGQG